MTVSYSTRYPLSRQAEEKLRKFPPDIQDALHKLLAMGMPEELVDKFGYKITMERRDTEQQYNSSQNRPNLSDLKQVDYLEQYNRADIELNQELQQSQLNQPSRETPKYKKTEIPKLSEDLCIQFIGGPKNSEQVFYKRKDYPQLSQGAIFTIMEDTPPLTLDETQNIIHSIVATYQYKLTFIPPNETSFSDAQIVVAIYQ